MPGKAIISNAIMGALALALDNQYTRPEITALLMRSGVTGSDPYTSSKKQMVTDWLAATNRDHEQPIDVLNGILEDLFDGKPWSKNPESLEKDRKMVRDALAKSGLTYSHGHVTMNASAVDRVFTAADINFTPQPPKIASPSIEPIAAAPRQAPAQPQQRRPAQPNDNKIMVIYGQNEAARSAMFAFLRSLGLWPLQWEELIHRTGEGSPYTGEAVKRGISDAGGVIVLLTGDDLAMLRPTYHSASRGQEEITLTPQARPNVILEYGMAMMADQAKVIVVELEHVRGISDTFGRNTVRYGSDDGEFRHKLINRLKTIGCPVNDTGYDFRTQGDFAAAISYNSRSIVFDPSIEQHRIALCRRTHGKRPRSSKN